MRASLALFVAFAVTVSAVGLSAGTSDVFAEAPFVEPGVDPQTYVDRYNNEPAFAQWFDDNYAEYDSIYHAVGLESQSAPVAADDPVAGEDAVPRDDPAPPPEPVEVAVPEKLELPRLDVPLAPFVDETADPMTYVNRYHTEETFAQWFDDNYAAEYGTIYRAVGLLDVPAPFVEPGVDPQTYVDRYNNEPAFAQWFDENYSEYLSIHHAVGLLELDTDTIPADGAPVSGEPDAEPEPAPEPLPPPVIAPGAEVPPGLVLQPGQEFGECGEGTELVNGHCIIIGTEPPPPPQMVSTGPPASQDDGGGCLIATAAYGTEMAPQVQMLREIRDGKLAQTAAGSSFVDGFNAVYYSFSPHVADYQRENPAFRDAVGTLLTPMLYTLGVMERADSEQEIVAYGLAAILATIAIYAGAPAASALYAARYYGQARRDLRQGTRITGDDAD